jgi:geranylgeranyl diphosphate synthase, type II
MDVVARIEQTLREALATARSPGCPTGLGEAMHHAVFPRGARVRSRLCLAVAAACGDDAPELADAAACAIELLHCASLVHDDLPCFDDAATRRGRPSVARAFGTPLAVLTGDALIVLAFQAMAGAGAAHPARLPGLLTTIGAGVGVPVGIVAGQAWECEPEAELALYQREKTGALFAAATMAGACAAGGDGGPWRRSGLCLGEAYQVADDILDAMGSEAQAGKPVAQDAAHARPSAVARLGLGGALRRLQALSEEASEALPPCEGRVSLQGHILTETMRLVPKGVARHAA